MILPLLLAASGVSFPGQVEAQTAEDLNEASLEELMNIKVSSVQKKDQVLSEAGASVYVITQEDIRRSGMHNIPDLLLMVPGVEVAQLDG
ncbi:MAG TPA: TonB-dependent receptor plug domain-containing protein [Bryobacteraceae bacterium]|nr:TonB-dependent receptor plug domain-containing protein [Bryobacteraceae bacterium]